MVVPRSFVFAHFVCVCVLSLALLESLSGCSQSGENSPDPAAGAAPLATEAEVDGQGANLKLSDVASVTIPPGAMVGDAKVTLATASAPVPLDSAVSNVLALTPHGIHFALPVKVTLKYQSSRAPGSLSVLRLADEQDNSWEAVGGVKFEDGVASFETTTFSYYAVVEGFDCVPATAMPAMCGGGGSCSEGAFCSSDNKCLDIATTDFCANKSLYVINGELPPDLVNIDEKQRSDAASAQEVVGTLAPKCGLTPTTVSQAEPGILDPCTDAPLMGEGNTVVVVGGSFGQRMAGFLDKNLAPVVSTYDETNGTYAFLTRSGETLTSFPESSVSPTHDYFLIQVLTEPARGALVLYLYGMGWEGTPAGAWYFSNVLYPQVMSGDSWSKYLLIEWIDDGDGEKGAHDTFNVIAQLR